MPLVTATFSTGGNVTITDAVEVTAINALTAAISQFSAASVNVTGTPAANIANMAESLNDISNLLTDIVSQQQEINNNMQLMVKSLTRVQTTMGTGVTTAQLSYINQAKNNQFFQEQANAAMDRAELPRTSVPPGDFVAQVQQNITEISDLQLQSKVAGLTQDGLNYVGELATNAGRNLIEDALDATGISGLWNEAKKKFAATFPSLVETRKKAAQNNAVKRSATSGRPVIQIPPDANIG